MEGGGGGGEELERIHDIRGKGEHYGTKRGRNRIQRKSAADDL